MWDLGILLYQIFKIRLVLSSVAILVLFCVVDHGASRFGAGRDRALERGRQGLLQFLKGVFTVDDASGLACVLARLSGGHIKGVTEGALNGASCRWWCRPCGGGPVVSPPIPPGSEELDPIELIGGRGKWRPTQCLAKSTSMIHESFEDGHPYWR